MAITRMRKHIIRGATELREEALHLIDDAVSSPKIDSDTGKVDNAWVALKKLQIDTYLRLSGVQQNDEDIDIEI